MSLEEVPMTSICICGLRFYYLIKSTNKLKNNLRMTFYKSKMCLMSASHDFSLCSCQCQKTQFKNHTKFEQFYGVKLLECI